MRSKIFSLIALAVGVLSAALGFVLPFIYMNRGTSSDMIGGADTATYEFFFWRYGSLPIIFVLLGASLTLAGLFSLIFSKGVSKNCSVKTTLIALSLSIFGATGLNCFFFCYVCAVFNEKSAYPRAYPTSCAGMLLSLFAFVALIVWYCAQRQKKFSIFGALTDVATSIIFLPFFTFATDYAIEFFRTIF